ncbi:MAG: PIN domain-containing protein [Candidatus Latescibacteria bacterium]|nr:PIN domain-containing protein [Candidatus Latescibacterota bacterium]
MKALLDTNGLSALWSGDERVLEVLGRADTVFMSIIVLGELHAGFRGGTQLQENRTRLAEFLTKPTVRLPELSADTAEVYGLLKDQLKRAGTPIPINDVWLAAQAIETGAVLITFDHHFSKVQGLRLWEP